MNTAIGSKALFLNTTGGFNTGHGFGGEEEQWERQ